MTASPMPASVKIGHLKYKIVEWAPRESVSADRYGECSHAEQVIRVTRMFGRPKQASTLLHEIIHAIWAMWSIHDGDNEERTVGMLEKGLAAVWVDNPDVFAWIGAGLTAPDLDG